jgi:UrcA family protein
MAATGGKDMMKLSLMAVLLLTGAPAIARDEPVGASVRVRTTDLDLTTAKGRSALDKRLSAAVDRVCPGRELFPSPHWNANAKCRSVAAKGARRERGRALAAAGVRAGNDMMASR